LPNGDDTTSTTTSIGSDSNPEPNDSPETENLHEELARVTPEAEVEDLRRQLERATLEREQFELENEQIKHENQRLHQRLDKVRRISAGLAAEPQGEEEQS
jgi:predicted RNase H-like nuclease (RuvC/YqgF family)